jgi:hypothetical protein
MDELACTLVVALVGPNRACFLQIGDGGVVIRIQNRYRLIFRPHHGEIAESTYFLTDPDVSLHLRFFEINESIDGVAAFTDGLEPLLLAFPEFSIHQPFFDKAFAAAEQPNTPEELREQLFRFLNSSHVNQRTTDDKTLILATRIPPNLPEPTDAPEAL